MILKLFFESNCKYEHFGSAYRTIPLFAKFADKNILTRTCEHLAINYCLRQNGAKIALATKLYTFYGTNDKHG